MKMKNGHKIVLEWAKENDEAEEKNDDTKMVQSRNERYTLSDRCGNS